ncbi:MAG: hypothetical protein HC905_26960 [Bacteroidales bacterium]|nr:hypothetical protein [Bacteroidales bacterium]
MKKILTIIVLAGAMFSISGNMDAQNIIVTGSVISAEDKLPVTGATVIEKGTNNGGNY